MNIPKEVANELVAQLLPMLKEVKYIVTKSKIVQSGKQLINSGIYKTESGEQILPGQTYTTRVPVYGLVNHEKKIKKIILEAKTEAQMDNDLGLYLAKNARSLEAITGEEEKGE